MFHTIWFIFWKIDFLNDLWLGKLSFSCFVQLTTTFRGQFFIVKSFLNFSHRVKLYSLSFQNCVNLWEFFILRRPNFRIQLFNFNEWFVVANNLFPANIYIGQHMIYGYYIVIHYWIDEILLLYTGNRNTYGFHNY